MSTYRVEMRSYNKNVAERRGLFYNDFGGKVLTEVDVDLLGGHEVG
jgi:hypothetical protein